MTTLTLTAETAIPVAERTLATLREVQELVERPQPLSVEMLERRLSPNKIAAAHLAAAAKDLSTVIALPERGAGESISRESVSGMLGAPISLLERFIVRAKFARDRGGEVSADDARKHLMVAASVVSTLLAATATFPQPEEAQAGGAADAGTFLEP